MKKEKEKNAKEIEDIEKKLSSYEKEQGRLCIDVKKNTSSIETFSKDALKSTEVHSKLSRDLAALEEAVLKTREERYINKDYCKSEHSKSNNFKCDLCGKGFNECHALETHLIKDHGRTKSFTCEMCNAKFVERLRFGKHVRMHKHEFNIRHCHYFNNGKPCPFEEYGCKFLHKESKLCHYGVSCEMNMCQFRHT